jgi:hypothetical protein
VAARRDRRDDQRRHRHGVAADPAGNGGARPEPVPADQLDQLDQLAAAARQQQPTTATVKPARRPASSSRSGRAGAGNPPISSAPARRVAATQRPVTVDDGRPCACQDDGPKCLLHYSARRR